MKADAGKLTRARVRRVSVAIRMRRRDETFASAIRKRNAQSIGASNPIEAVSWDEPYRIVRGN